MCGIDLEYKPTGEDWCSCEWYGLRDDKGGSVGEVRLFMNWALPRDAELGFDQWKGAGEDVDLRVQGAGEDVDGAGGHLPEWLLQVTVLECKDLKSMERVGKNDVPTQGNIYAIKSVNSPL